MRTLISLLPLPASVRRLRPLLVGAALFAGYGAPAQGLASLTTSGAILAGGPTLTGRVEVPGTHEQVCASLEADGWTLVAVSYTGNRVQRLYVSDVAAASAGYALVSDDLPVQVVMYAGWPELRHAILR
ncbi:hypothetical protein ACFQDE_05155 [Deinococcus caeni]|uniref:Uncharacterized protein n=1 Tax=Deinococcus caeni TaxID=569127 RepID=A0ABP9UCF6_9DEIO